MSYRSHEILQGPGYANVRALYKADGYAEEELKRPIIGIANAYNSICPGHIVLRQMAERIREGIQAAGGMPIEFGTIGACDGIAMGHEGMRYILPAREMIANDVEAMVQAHRLDGIVLLGSCDKIIPGMLIGAMRVNLPAIFINGGPSLPGHMADGNPYGGEWIDHSCIQQSEGALQAEKITEKEFKWIEDNAMPTVGSCAMLGTANTMGCLAEAMGIMLPGSATIPAVYSKRMAAAYNSGKAIVDLVHKNIRIQDIITKRALANAIMVNSAMGGSTNAVLHLLAIAHSGKINLTIDDFETISSGIQHLVAMIPAGKYTLFDFFEAGGVQALMKEMEEKLYVDALTCTGDGLEIPKTMDDLYAVSATFNENGITPIAMGEKDKWPGLFPFGALALRYGGVEKTITMLNGEGNFDQEFVQKTAEELQKMVDEGVFASDSVALTDDEATEEFRQGRAAMWYSGNWKVDLLCEEGSPLEGKLTMVNWPAVSGADGDQNSFVGGASATLVASATSAHKKEAVEFMTFMSEHFSNYAYEEGAILPTWKYSGDMELKPFQQTLLDLMQGADGFCLAWDTLLDPETADVHSTSLQGIYAQQMTADDYVEAMAATR